MNPTDPRTPPDAASGVEAAGSPGDAPVRVAGLWRRYGVVPALADVSLQIGAGTVVGVLGPNGAGKTTLLRVLASLVRPGAGVAMVCGFDVARAGNEVRARVGYVGHTLPVHPFLSVEENVRFAALLHGVAPRAEILERALERAGLTGRRRAPARTLSRGLAQRLALACARVHEPAVLLLDEPHTGLDPGASDALDAQIRETRALGGTVLLATHDLDRAHALTDRLLVLVDGRMAWDVPTASSAPALLAGLVGRHAGSTRAWPGAGLPDDARRSPNATPVPAPDAPATGTVSPSMDRATEADRHAHAPSFRATVGALLWKDVAVELRAREVVPPVIVFALLMVVVFEFAMPAGSVARQPLAAGALWVALLFGSTLGLSRLVAGDADTGGFEALLSSPADRGAVFAGKWLAGYGFSIAVAAVLLPAFVALLGLQVSVAQLGAVAGIVALGLIGWVAAGVLIAAMAVATRAREVLLPVLLYPLVLPLIVPAVQATGGVLTGDARDAPAAVALVAAYDLIFWVLGFLLFGRVLED